MEIEGKIILDLGKQEGTSKAGNHWQKREWVLETLNSQYPRKVKFHIFGDKADQMVFELGKNYSISYDIESREFNGRWYTDISCYAMRPLEGTAQNVPGEMSQPNFQQGGGTLPPLGQSVNFGQAQTPDFATPAGDESDDLPF